MANFAELRRLGPHPAAQIVPTRDDSDLVSQPVAFVAGKHKMTNHGGPTIAVPKTILVWCGPAGVDRPKFERFAYELVAFGYLSCLSYAGCTGGEWWGSFDGPVLAQRTWLDSELQAQLRAWLPSCPYQPDGRTIYSLMLPPGVQVKFDGSSDTSCAQFCGYHSSLDGGNILYTVEPCDTCSGCNQGDAFAGQTMVYSHEIGETVTDPTGQGWYEDSTGMECGDIVAWIAKQYGPWTVQGEADPDGNNVMGAYTPVADPQPKPSGCKASALAAAQPVVDGYAAKLKASPRSSTARYGLKGAQDVVTALGGLQDGGS